MADTFQVHGEEVEVLPPEQPSDGIFTGNDLALLEENRALRRSLIQLLAPAGKVPDDKADKTMLLNLMNGLDAEIMTRARVKIAAKTEETMGNLTSVVSQALLQYKVAHHHEVTEEALVMPQHLTNVTPVPGQMDIGVINLTMEDIEEK